jgi:hypothetical protein
MPDDDSSTKRGILWKALSLTAPPDDWKPPLKYQVSEHSSQMQQIERCRPIIQEHFAKACTLDEKWDVLLVYIERIPYARTYDPWLKTELQSLKKWPAHIEKRLAQIAEAHAHDTVMKERVTKIRAEIVRRYINSATDFRNREKVKKLCATLDEAKIPIPARKSRLSSGKAGLRGYEVKTHTWTEISNSPNSALYKWLFKPRTSPLLTDLYKSQKR